MTMFHMLHRISNGIMAHASRKQENWGLEKQIFWGKVKKIFVCFLQICKLKIVIFIAPSTAYVLELTIGYCYIIIFSVRNLHFNLQHLYLCWGTFAYFHWGTSAHPLMVGERAPHCKYVSHNRDYNSVICLFHCELIRFCRIVIAFPIMCKRRTLWSLYTMLNSTLWSFRFVTWL